MSLDFQRLERILAEAAGKRDQAARAAFLDHACGGDEDLRAEVERLLAAHRQAGDFLEKPALEENRKAGSEPAPEVMERPGARIGRYKLLEEIGEGAFGVVYMAEQLEPVQRKVALKVIKAGMDTREVVARFEAERQALALMDHPSIARVFDGGITQAGRPYFVMELVQGIAITEFCDQRSLSTPERLRLFIQVCHAVQHAHQKGIIHRDLKPSNILVTLIDGQPVPKVIDFGVAKALGRKLTDKTLFTGFLRMVGTPAYMSPEQADLSGVDIDTRSDIYALGVLLYELLTGVTPFDSETLHRAALDELRRLIREAEPPKPSTRLSGLNRAQQTTAAKHRQVEPAALSRLVRGDLDWIVMKCLEKQRGRRYETANALARDIEQHLNQEPVSAVAPSALYRLRKFVRRNRAATAATAVVFSTLLVGAGATTWLYWREREAFREQTRLRLEAEKARAAEASARSQLERRFDVMRARELANEGHYSEAEELLNRIEPEFRKGDSTVAKTRRSLAWQWILRRRWNEAADRLAALVRDDDSEWNGDIAVDHFNYANMLVQTGRTEEYGTWRRSILTRFASVNDPELSKFLCETTMYTPASEDTGRAIARHYDVARDRLRYPEEGDQEKEAWRRFSMALTDYRLGNFRRAAQLCDSAISLPVGHAFAIAEKLALSAMAHHQLNEQDQARLALASCHQIVDPVMETGPSAFSWDKMGVWMVWVQNANLQHEADGLMGAPSAGDYDRLAEARAKLEEAERLGANPGFYDAARPEHDRAARLAADTPALLQRTEGRKFAGLLKALGLWELQHHQWREAVTNWSLVVYGPSNYGSLLYGQDLSGFCQSLAPLLAELDDVADYERFRSNALETLGEPGSPVNAARTLEACLLRPAGERQMSALAKLANVLTAKPASFGVLPAGDLALALFRYRSGDPAGALESVRTHPGLAGKTPALSARAAVLRALCLARIGSSSDAQAELDSVRETIDHNFNSPPISQPADLETWHDWWVDHILLQEAQASFQQKP